MKGNDINFVGQVEGLGAERKKELRELNYQDLTDGPAPQKENKFFAAQKEKRLKNEQTNPLKHVMAVEPREFIDPVTKKRAVDEFGKLPFPTIDIIFNHKNIWANLQHHNP